MLLRRHHKKESAKEKDYNQLTNKELKSILDKKGVEYNQDAKKADLVKLIQK